MATTTTMYHHSLTIDTGAVVQSSTRAASTTFRRSLYLPPRTAEVECWNQNLLFLLKRRWIYLSWNLLNNIFGMDLLQYQL